MKDPAIVMADEPTGNLDSQNAESLHRIFLELKKELNQTFIMVTHNMDLAGMADRVLEMKDGFLTEKSSLL
jgi:lipoprotein-releasing system ATP-binding protein